MEGLGATAVSIYLLPQLLAASIICVGLRYRVYGSIEEYARDHADLEELHGHLFRAGCTLGDLRELLLELQAACMWKDRTSIQRAS